ncbi:TetR/AcrR family transcriptional regulator [Planomonospora venezuelensis]|uniref:AcrR family transcriptional regulator n=1 Tax=Planomonospora venezuelensis TaxID=1999 RepID=A0A841D7M2_PLAVE|nr:TetR/AcrR family transcriptional regulator [Planomonospora venezuelensis]MBB5965930.1 AcrR family transcriptional regulator [Planomonospora venezuelensis]GIN01316.1 TetR family transcriptional regulator [Planomonospora venezuelensis]
MRDQADTRTRIQEVALKLFVEQGYEATSLREIAEALGVTKAALYYHFKTKDDIVTSLAENRLHAIEELAAWAGGQPRSDETRRELIRRYADELYQERHHEIMRFFERNQTALKHHPVMEKTRERMLDLITSLMEPGDPPATRLRNSMALFAMHASWFLLKDDALTDDERKAAALEVALELLRR